MSKRQGRCPDCKAAQKEFARKLLELRQAEEDRRDWYEWAWRYLSLKGREFDKSRLAAEIRVELIQRDIELRNTREELERLKKPKIIVATGM